jgi:ribosomal protein S18 acetylase RimI-like enzyme
MWPELAIVAEQVGEEREGDDPSAASSSSAGSPEAAATPPTIVGYVLGKVSVEKSTSRSPLGLLSSPHTPPAGHVTSLAVLPEARRLGIANALMGQLHQHLIARPYQVRSSEAGGAGRRRGSMMTYKTSA